MREARALLMAAAGVIAGCLVLSGCGSHDPDGTGRPEAGPDAVSSSTPATPTPSTTAGPTARPSASKSAGTTPSTPAERAALNGKVASVDGTTAAVTTPGGDVAIEWSAATVIVDTVNAAAKDVRVGACVLVLPEGSPSRTAKTVTAATVRVIESSPSCPRKPGTGLASPSPGSLSGGNDSGGITVVGGSGVIGTVTAKSGARFTLRSRTDGSARVVTVTTTKATRYRKAGEKPRAAVAPGRCATVWGSRHHAGRVVATRIRMSDPVGGACQA